MEFRIRSLPGKCEGQRVLALEGALTRATVTEFEDVARAERSNVVIVDFAGVPYVDSDGLGAIIKAYVSCAKAGRQLVLAAVPDRFRTLMKITAIEQIIPIFSSVDEAGENLCK